MYGTAQGGILGPVIFLIFINDLLNFPLNSKIFAYADDTALVCSAYNKDSLKIYIQDDLNKVSSWLVNNRLLINTTKSKCILFFDQNKNSLELQNDYQFYCHPHSCVYCCNCSCISIVDSVTYLGMVVDRDLKWNQHIAQLSGKLRSINYSLYHMRGYLESQHLINLYHSWFESTLRYGIIHYGGTYTTTLKSIISCQRKSLRIIFYINRRERLSYMFKEKNILTFNQIYNQSCLSYTHKYFNEFPLKVVNRETRASQFIKIKVQNFTKERSRNQFCYSGPKVFNNFVEHFGNEVIFAKKPKVKMKIKEFILELP